MLSAKPAEEAPPRPSIPRPPAPSFFPFHIVPGLSNFRDVGGWPIASPDSPDQIIGHVRKGILYRGSDTNNIKPEGEVKLRELGIKTDFDLRSKQQIEKAGGYKEVEGSKRVWTPVFKEEQYTEEEARRRYELYAGEGTDGIVTAFIEILISGAHPFASILRHLLSTIPPPNPSSPYPSTPQPALFMHCTTGNNRTGIFISLLLLLLNVPHASICEEYALSEQGLAPTRHINVGRLLKKGAFKEYGEEEGRRKCERMVGAREESMWALIEEVKRRWGGPEGYFLGDVGLSEEEIGKLRGVFAVREESRLFTPSSPTLNLAWTNRNQYVNISLSRFDWYGGGDIFQAFVTKFYTKDEVQYKLPSNLGQGVYAFFISTVDKDPAETPFFAYVTDDQISGNSSTNPAPSAPASSKGGLSQADKVGIGLGVPFGILLLGFIGLAVWFARKWKGEGPNERKHDLRQETIMSRPDVAELAGAERRATELEAIT
ncbi:hypothetical protein K469DRAFT_687241 [Zopfia rhizophila CBS 207.26]|uniref:Tyrosine specific protein phosphatases domain-containing protein n=1 Tax=Zopfia rhizophila CBS 207.26 TaxID=1314779 RepID=A0A6A6E6Z8_9PEZI|nr:hypothetical protein K469DRAFT_687241 [Zopfia rhizophila CBS 207.26]